MKLYLYTSEQGLRDIIEKRYLIVSTPWSTNDITECVAQREEKQSESIKQYGYICMSETPTSPAMWGYYADRSRGACLAFHIRDNDLFPDADIQQVKYERNRSACKDPIDLLSIKALDWQHEKEYRIIFKLSDLEHINTEEHGKRKIIFIHRGIMGCLREIILGVRCNIECAQIQAMVSDRVSIKRVRIHPETFEFDFDETITPARKPKGTTIHRAKGVPKDW